MVIAGVDYSMTSPSICVYDTKKKLCFQNTKVFVYSSKANLAGQTDNIFIMKQLPYDSQQERFDNISEWALAILQKFNVKKVCIEGYSFGSKSNSLFQIGENGGVLKHKLFKNKIEITTATPSEIKKFFSNKGNAKKQDMYDAFIKTNDYNIIEKLGIKTKDPYESPVSDIIDSFAILCYMKMNL